MQNFRRLHMGYSKVFLNFMLIRNVVTYLKMFPSRHGISATLTSRSIINGFPHLDYNMMKLVFGSYIQLSTDNAITNTTTPGTIGVIVLDPKGTNGTYSFMSIETGRKVHGRIVRELPTSNEVIDRVNKLGLQQKQPDMRGGGLFLSDAQATIQMMMTYSPQPLAMM